MSELKMSESKQKKYWAFISYSSRDAKWGKWLHKRLENYSIPTEFQQIEFVDGTKLGKHVRPVFRDRDELSGSAELGPAIMEALENSRFLIVLCSPNSAKSKWVNKEIEDFRAIHGDDKVLALILDGEPNASSSENLDNDLECFPPALRAPLEPLAGDLRPEADGKERGFLKIIAGIADIGFDDLYRRHERAKKRNRLLVGVAAVILIALLTSLSIYAFAQKSIAEDKTKVAQQEKDRADKEANRASEASRSLEIQLEESEKARASARFSLANSHWKTGRVNDARKALLGIPAKRRNIEWAFAYREIFGSDFVIFDHGFASHSLALETAYDSLGIISSPHPPVTDIQFTHDGTRIVSAVANKLKLWNSSSGDFVCELVGHTAAITCLAVSKNDQLIVSGSKDKTVRVWDLASKQEIAVFDASDNFDRPISVTDVGFIRGGKAVVVACNTDSVNIWEVETGEISETLQLPKSTSKADGFNVSGTYFRAKSFELSPDEKNLWTSGYPSMRVFDIEAESDISPPHILKLTSDSNLVSRPGKQLIGFVDNGTSSDNQSEYWQCQISEANQTSIQNLSQEYKKILFSPDGKYCGGLATGNWRNQIDIWRVSDGEIVKTFFGRFGIRSFAFSPDGRRIAYGDENLICVDHINDGSHVVLAQRSDRSFGELFISDDRQSVVALRSTGNKFAPTEVTYWSEGLVRGPSTYKISINKSIARAQMSPDGDKLLFTNYVDETLGILELETRNLRSINHHESKIKLFDISQHIIAIIDSDSRLKVFDANTLASLCDFKIEARRPSKIKISPQGQQVYIVNDDMGITISAWDIKSGKRKKRKYLTEYSGASRPVISEAQNQLMLKAGGAFKTLDLNTLELMHQFQLAPSGLESINKLETRLFAQGYDEGEGHIQIWDREGQLLYSRLGVKGKLIDKMLLNEADQLLIAILTKSEGVPAIFGWDVRLHYKPRMVQLQVARLTQFAIDSTGNRIAFADESGRIRCKDLGSGKLVLDFLDSKTHRVNDIAFSPDGLRLLATSTQRNNDGYEDFLSVYDLSSNTILNSWELEFASKNSLVAMSSDGRTIAIADEGKLRAAWAEDGRQVASETLNRTDFIFSGNFSHNMEWYVAAWENSLLILNTQSQLSERERFLRDKHASIDLLWHTSEAEHSEKEKDYFGATFHWAWAIKGAPESKTSKDRFRECLKAFRKSKWKSLEIPLFSETEASLKNSKKGPNGR